ncbi:hypothetical protein KBI23_04805 [bacterium]|nr:hypothetical protein [bacterium]MBP9807214.1 hypothetical protein [bacterium]
MALDDRISKPEQVKLAAAEGPSNLQCEAWPMSKASDTAIDAAAKLVHGDKAIEGPHKAEIDKQFGGQAGFMRQMGQDLRSQYSLPADASSEQLYHKMAADAVAIFPTMTKAEKAAGLASLQLDGASIKDEGKVFKALIDRDRRDADLSALSLPELKANGCSAMKETEVAAHLTAYKDAVKNGIKIDYN